MKWGAKRLSATRPPFLSPLPNIPHHPPPPNEGPSLGTTPTVRPIRKRHLEQCGSCLFSEATNYTRKNRQI